MGKKRSFPGGASSSSISDKDGGGIRVMKPGSESKSISTRVMKSCSKSQAIGTTSESEPASESQAIGSSVLDPSSVSESNLKKQKMLMKSEQEIDDDTITVSKSGYNQLKESIKLLSETMKMLQEILPTKSDLLEFSLKEQTPQKKMKPCSDSKAKGKSVLDPCTESKAIGTSMLDPCSESESKPKKHMKSEEIDEDELILSKREYKQMKKSIKVLSKTVTKLEETLVTKADLLVESPLKEKETPQRNDEPKFTCCFDCEDARGGNNETLLVKGFDNVRSRDKIKKDLKEIFGSVRRVFVPIECKTRVPLGFAFVDLKKGECIEKALKRFNNSCMRGRKLKVKMAKDSYKSHAFPDFEGCERCQFSKFSPRYYEGICYDKLMIPRNCY